MNSRLKYRGICLLLGLFALPAVNGQDLPQPNLHFEGNHIFAASQLREVLGKCLATDPTWSRTQNVETLEYCASMVRNFLYSKGYLQAKVGTPRREEWNGGMRWSIPVAEGALFRLGEIEIRGSTVLSPNELRQLLDLKAGDIVNASCILIWLEERASTAYKNFGYLQFATDLRPTFHLRPEATEGLVDLKVTVYEGRAFTIKSITFVGQREVSQDVLRRWMLVTVGEIFNKALFDESLKRTSQSGQFETIDLEKDVDYKTDRESSLVDITIRLKRKTS